MINNLQYYHQHIYMKPSDENWIYDIVYYYKTRAKDDCMPIFGHELALRYRLELTGDIANPVLFVGNLFPSDIKFEFKLRSIWAQKFGQDHESNCELIMVLNVIDIQQIRYWMFDSKLIFKLLINIEWIYKICINFYSR